MCIKHNGNGASKDLCKRFIVSVPPNRSLMILVVDILLIRAVAMSVVSYFTWQAFAILQFNQHLQDLPSVNVTDGSGDYIAVIFGA